MRVWSGRQQTYVCFILILYERFCQDGSVVKEEETDSYECALWRQKCT